MLSRLISFALRQRLLVLVLAVNVANSGTLQANGGAAGSGGSGGTSVGNTTTASGSGAAGQAGPAGITKLLKANP